MDLSTLLQSMTQQTGATGVAAVRADDALCPAAAAADGPAARGDGRTGVAEWGRRQRRHGIRSGCSRNKGPIGKRNCR